jgi:hypothetical protein
VGVGAELPGRIVDPLPRRLSVQALDRGVAVRVAQGASMRMRPSRGGDVSVHGALGWALPGGYLVLVSV